MTDFDHDILQRLTELSAENDSLRQQITASDKSTLRLLETIKYLVGIAEHGEGRKLFDKETIEQFVLGYVKRIENQLAECQARRNQLLDVLYLHKNAGNPAYELMVEQVLKDRPDSTVLDTMLAAAELKGRREALLDAKNVAVNLLSLGYSAESITSDISNMAKELE